MDPVVLAVFDSDLGWMCAAARGEVLCELSFGYRSPKDAVHAMRHSHSTPSNPDAFLRSLARRLQRFCHGPSDDFLDIQLDLREHTDFQRAVVNCCRKVPAGEMLTYADLAKQAGHPRAARAVGQVMAANRFPIIVPCHRVVGCNGSLGGYSARDGVNMKRRLLTLEGAPLVRAH